MKGFFNCSVVNEEKLSNLVILLPCFVEIFWNRNTSFQQSSPSYFSRSFREYLEAVVHSFGLLFIRLAVFLFMNLSTRTAFLQSHRFQKFHQFNVGLLVKCFFCLLISIVFKPARDSRRAVNPQCDFKSYAAGMVRRTLLYPPNNTSLHYKRSQKYFHALV